MDNSVDNPPIRYDITTLTETRDKIREIAERINLQRPPGEQYEADLRALEITESFLTDTIATLTTLEQNRRDRRRQNYRNRRRERRSR